MEPVVATPFFVHTGVVSCGTVHAAQLWLWGLQVEEGSRVGTQTQRRLDTGGGDIVLNLVGVELFKIYNINKINLTK